MREPLILAGAKYVEGMKVGEHYTYVRDDKEVECEILSIDSDGTCTVMVIHAKGLHKN